MNDVPTSASSSAGPEPSSARRSGGRDVNTEEAPDWNSGFPSEREKPGFSHRLKTALLDASERARGGLSMRGDNFFLLLSVIIGLFAGLAVVCFRISIDYTRLWLLGSGVNPGPARIVIVPTVAGLFLAFLVLRIFPRVKGSGVTQTKSAVYIYDGYIPFDTVVGKFLTCALAIGSGQSLGPEDPSLQMGAGIASALGRRLHLSRDKVRLIAPVGAAAGLAAAFNAPISAVLFVIEEVIGTWSAGILGAVVLAAVASVVVMRLFLGAEPLFQIPPYSMAHAAELLHFAAFHAGRFIFSRPSPG
jgi:chloride channel protein, CIC family